MDPRRVVDIARLSDAAFFVEVAAGLPLIHENAVRIWESVLVLAERKHYRAAQILKTVALEEAAKYLILLDAVRCPRKPDMKKFSDQLKKFYAHLARGLYAEICDWRPADLRELRVNIERECRTYYLDGPHDVDPPGSSETTFSGNAKKPSTLITLTAMVPMNGCRRGIAKS